MSSPAHRRNQVLLPASALFGLALILFGLCQASLPEILSGLYTILDRKSVV